MSFEYEYLIRCVTPSDINQHLPALRELAQKCDSVVELGTRSGNSSVAFVAANPHRLHSIDLTFKNLDRKIIRLAERHCRTQWTLQESDTLELEAEDIPECDLLFIDTLHTEAQIAHELTFSVRASRYIAIHDTVTFWKHGEKRQPGIGTAILEFLNKADGRNWAIDSVHHHNNGLLVLRRKGAPDE